RQKEILKFINIYTKIENRPPTIIEIRENFKLVSNQGVIDHLKALEKKGYIKRLTKSRGIIILKSLDYYPILGQVSAGNPIDSEEYHEGNLKFEEMFDPETSYVIRIKGDSMKNAGILDGDFVIIDHQGQVESGDIGIVVIGGETTVKRILFEGDNVILQPENENYSPITVNIKKTQLLLCGKVIGVLRKL
ncbi:MAG: transcriptional repressor LexA, partial [Spirochaetota bacterium]|nr:transcriptional repressor LexA [Spirochaetota bacterium]